MPQLCLYLHLHQPYRLRSFQIEEIGNSDQYFESASDTANRAVFQKVAQKSYLPMLTLLRDLLHEIPQFVVSFSVTGLSLEQAERWEPSVLRLLQEIMATGRGEILAETYYHSLAGLYSEAEFTRQVRQHAEIIDHFFAYRPTLFRNTELVYANAIAKQVAALGYKGILTEGVDRILHGRPLTRLYYSVGEEQLPILLKHAQLSDDIAFRFSDRHWEHFPLAAETYLEWVQVYGEAELVNLFMDFETFGEHQWADTGIFPFFETFVRRFASQKWNRFVLPSEVVAASPWQVRTQMQSPAVGRANPAAILGGAQEMTERDDGASAIAVPPAELRYDAPEPISWADVDRDLSAWLENSFQQDCVQQLYELETGVLATNDTQLINDWRRLQTSDHFYYMCTKWSADGDVHAYFSPYRDPFEAYRRYSVVLADLKHRLWQRQGSATLPAASRSTSRPGAAGVDAHPSHPPLNEPARPTEPCRPNPPCPIDPTNRTQPTEPNQANHADRTHPVQSTQLNHPDPPHQPSPPHRTMPTEPTLFNRPNQQDPTNRTKPSAPCQPSPTNGLIDRSQ